MKTAMQELIENLDVEMKSRGMLPNWDMYLKKEKEQIIEAHFEGWSDAYDYLSEFNNDKARQAEEYYEETYEIE